MTSRRLLDPISKALLDAADIMEERGLAKNTLCDQEGHVCLRGALLLAVGVEVGRNGFFNSFHKEAMATMALADYRVARYLGISDPPQWNNHHSRTQAEVVSALRGAAMMEVDHG